MDRRNKLNGQSLGQSGKLGCIIGKEHWNGNGNVIKQFNFLEFRSESERFKF